MQNLLKTIKEIDFDSIGIDELISPENLATEEIKAFSPRVCLYIIVMILNMVY